MGMGDCPLLMGSREAMCPMKILDHMSAWQKLFTAIPVTEGLLLLVMIVMAAALFRVAIIPTASPPLSFYFKNYQKNNPAARQYNFWLALFSRGIVQPKLLA